MAVNYDRTSPVYDNNNVDNISEQSGVIDKLPSLSLDIDDSEIIRNLDYRINESRDYWDDAKGFDLKNTRNENIRYYLGKIDEKGLYKHQKPYKENQIFLGEESITSYVTAQIAGPVVIPASREDRSKLFAGDLEKAIKAHGEDVVDLERIIELVVHNIRLKRLGVIKLWFDKNYGDKGEIVCEAINPEHIIVDKNATLGSNPAFVCHVLKMSVEDCLGRYPKKRDDIMKKLGIQRKTPKQMSQELAIREVWVTHYKNNEPVEGVVWYFEDLVLEKDRNPNWLYASEGKNLLKFAKKPFIFGNLVNLGDHLIDDTTPVEQAIEQQKVLNRVGRQILEVAAKANGMLVISTDSGLTKDDAQNLTGDPNQKLVIKTNGQAVDQLVHQIEAQQLPDFIANSKLDARIQVGNLLGAPTDFTGSQADDGDPTLGEVMVKKNQSSGIQDKMVRAITRMMGDYYEYLTQMFIVWYDEDHSFVHDAGNGDFDYITLNRDLIEKGIRVKSGKPASPDRSRVEAVTMKLLEQKAISLLDAYKQLQLDNPQQLYDNWAKQNADPMSLARDVITAVDESEAYVVYQDIMSGQKVQPKENPTKEYILSLRKLMINDAFLNPDKGKRKYQKVFMDYVNACIDSLEQRAELDAVGQDPEQLRPQVPLQPPQPQMPMQQPGMMPQPQMGGMPPQMPGAQPMMPPQQPMQPPMGQPMPMQQPPMTPASVFATPPPQAPPAPPEPNMPSVVQ
jgi:hypothetical protein